MEMKKENNIVTVYPREYEGAIRNPLMGMRPYIWSDTSEALNPKPGPGEHEYSALRRHYIKWSDIEDNEHDDVDKIIKYCNKAWEGVEQFNIKVIPRVYLQWGTESQRHWPSDLNSGDWESEAFKKRLQRMIGKLGQAWDGDARVAYVEMGIYGKWGEHHSPEIPADIMSLMGDGFKESFHQKLVMRRKAWDFENYSYGIYWDSFAHLDEIHHAEGILKLGEFWKKEVVGGECAYDWGNWRIQPGLNATESLRVTKHRDYICHMIRKLHANHLGWIDEYDKMDEKACEGAALIQKALGYRFVIKEASYPARINMGQTFCVSFQVKNTASSPFYYNWPVELSLLNPFNRQVIWKCRFESLDIRRWLPGDRWNSDEGRYDVEAEVNTVIGEFVLPSEIPSGEYILALALIDPSGDLPSARFAIENYYNGGRHPIGKVGIGIDIENYAVKAFDDIQGDWILRY